jgi:Flp pilus assembly protein TadB
MSALALVAAAATAACLGCLMGWLVPPTPRLASRVRPYIWPGAPEPGEGNGSPVRRVFGPIVMRAARTLSRRLDGRAEAELALRLRRSGLYPDLGDEERLAAFRLRQLSRVGAGAAAFGVVALGVGLPPSGVLGLGLLGAVAALGRTRGRVERAVEDRAARMRIEIYTIDQLLALRVRAGGAVMAAVTQVVERGRGEVVAELAEAMRLHRAGLSVAEAFGRVADLSPEPACSRTYRLLAIADERGVDLAAGLLALAEDVRETRREAMKRAATRRRAAMLVPTIALLAPTLLLFVAAPLPYLLTGWR